MGEQLPNPHASEQQDLERYLSIIDMLLAQIIETGPELQDALQDMRNQLKDYMQKVGEIMKQDLQGIEDLAKVYDWTNMLVQNQKLTPPTGYMTKEELDQQLMAVVTGQVPEGPLKALDAVHATNIAQYARSDWRNITGRGQQKTLDYLYNLGIIMHSPLVYHAIFAGDDISIDDDWNVTNGRHRSFVLRAFGDTYVEQAMMNQWITVSKEKVDQP